MKKLIIFAGAMLLLAAGTAGFFASRPMSAQEALILRNVEAIAQGEPGGLPVECYDKYEAYAGGSLQRFRPCDTSSCEHIWAYRPRKRTVCQNK